jgi:hypothetical protein
MDEESIVTVGLDEILRPRAGMFDALDITRMQDGATLHWHEGTSRPGIAVSGYAPAADGTAGEPYGENPSLDPNHPNFLMNLALANHRANFDLWHEEDKARDPEASDAQVATIKHMIDALNQRRNDLVESIDRSLLEEANDQNPAAPLHSESPGLIVDRLSILALKIYHTAEESRRETASEKHRWKNRERLTLLSEQRDDLALCLNALWKQVLSGQQRFKIYRQMKMYNDPELNPAVYEKTLAVKLS